MPSCHSPARSAQQKSLLNQIGLEYILNGTAFLADGGAETVYSHRTAVELLDNGEQQLAIHHIEALMIHIQQVQGTIGHGAALRQKAFDFKRHEIDATGAQAVVTGCANCRINFMLGAAESGWDKPILSLVETVAETLAD